MAARRRGERVFEELGLLSDKPPVDPYKTLGLDQEFVSELLKDDPKGGMVRFAADALYKVLAKRLHPDMPTGDPDRFRAIQEANSRIENASKETLGRWARAERPTSSAQVDKLRANYEALSDRAAELLQRNLELGSHPNHFSRLEWSQGILLQRANMTLLMRQTPHDTLEVMRGEVANLDNQMGRKNSQLFDIQRFLLQHELFGLEPGTDIRTYIDENGRASILAPDLTFLMDITDPLNAHRAKRAKLSSAQASEIIGSSDAWSRSSDPLLIITTVPGASSNRLNQSQLITFPTWEGPERGGQDRVWDMPMEAVGTVTDQGFFNRVKHAKTKATAAIGGTSPQRAMNYFNRVPVPTKALIEQDAGYSPLLANGDSLLLYDPANNMPVVCDAKVMGMLGSDSKAA